MPRAVLLLSGGLDSTTLLAYAVDEGFTCHAMTFRYGQRHAVEIEAARRVATLLWRPRSRDRRHRSAHVRRIRADERRSTSPRIALDDTGIPITYVPARNTIFLSFALAWAEVLQAADIFIGVNALDYSGYPDCRPEYIAAYERMANLATRGGVEGTTTQFASRRRSSIARKRRSSSSDSRSASTTRSRRAATIPTPAGAACGHCDSCQLRLKGFAEAGVPDRAYRRWLRRSV